MVGGQLVRQPRSRAEALATARALRASGWNFSVGLGQINVGNFERLSLTVEAVVTRQGLPQRGLFCRPLSLGRRNPVQAFGQYRLHGVQVGAGLEGNLQPQGRKALYRHAWVVYAKTPMGGPAQVLNYLSRYTHRTAIGNERIKAITAQDELNFSVRADAHGGKRRVRLDGQEFIRHFLLHVLPSGSKRIRHYGKLANGRARPGRCGWCKS